MFLSIGQRSLLYSGYWPKKRTRLSGQNWGFMLCIEILLARAPFPKEVAIGAGSFPSFCRLSRARRRARPLNGCTLCLLSLVQILILLSFPRQPFFLAHLNDFNLAVLSSAVSVPMSDPRPAPDGTKGMQDPCREPISTCRLTLDSAFSMDNPHNEYRIPLRPLNARVLAPKSRLKVSARRFVYRHIPGRGPCGP